MDEQDYLTNAYEVRNAKDKRAQERRAKTLKAKRTARQKHVDRVVAANGFTSTDLLSWLTRHGKYRMAANTPIEEVKATQSANGKRGSVLAAIKRRFCRHDKLAPKLRASGKNVGKWVCPSCHAVVPAPGEEIQSLVL
jgi:hypothetical protein